MELIIKLLSGETCSVSITPSTTVGELKSTVARMFNISISHLKLSVNNGRTIHLDQDQRTVSDCGLTSGSTVMLLISEGPKPFQIFVKNEKGQIKSYEVTDEDTTAQLMEKIYDKDEVSVDQQRLIFNGIQLDKDKKLQDYNITPGSTIFMLLRLRGGWRA